VVPTAIDRVGGIMEHTGNVTLAQLQSPFVCPAFNGTSSFCDIYSSC